MATDKSGVVLTGAHVPESEPLSLRVVRLVADASGRDETDLEPLAQTLDTDALDALFSAARSRSDGFSVEVSFRYEGYRVEVDADGQVRVREAPDSPK